MSNKRKAEARFAGATGSLKRLVRPHCFIAPRGYTEPDGEYRSRFNFVWWFWLPRLHTQRPDAQNPRVIRLIWLCFAAGIDIWGDESRRVWPNAKLCRPADSEAGAQGKDTNEK